MRISWLPITLLLSSMTSCSSSSSLTNSSSSSLDRLRCWIEFCRRSLSARSSWSPREATISVHSVLSLISVICVYYTVLYCSCSCSCEVKFARWCTSRMCSGVNQCPNYRLNKSAHKVQLKSHQNCYPKLATAPPSKQRLLVRSCLRCEIEESYAY
ncbi:uncharacterized protein YALI1_B06324g [Yarrowia lipolytica]|uniref:Secreted protein n=1 Tax=Yarrowia lipolytica TaxID=4952 RepID=A0A1D8N6G7_YARLL|nr:hypothetical protein YALI1_B06324g [Yarrowia lipolytica]